MKPIETPDCNSVFVKEGCFDLPAIKAHDENNNNYVITVWEISPAELKKLNETGVIYLSIMGESIPPVNLCVDSPLEWEDKNIGCNDDSGKT